MKTIVRLITNILIFNLIYILAAFITPLILMLLGQKNFNFTPQLFGQALVKIMIQKNNFSSEATLMGIVCTSIFASFIFCISLLLTNHTTKEKLI
ncbi:hypothetical protein ATZ33_13435 [Enterococcus silesiacus]|uniref:ABC transmembrane type-1 domain-containing protein n=1 Tax=Enterococcus silesiacus TaxID=332949 RepID=A0ABM5WAT9_9ENTE|nr:hypothetical protein [Enterococcus silesiacus]ALS02351.1 hypothetical protein ATZ33_13435 [Enterococcus silesiacus]